MNWAKKRVLVTGGNGFLGSHLVESLQRSGYPHIWSPRSQDYDLRDQAAIERLMQDVCPDLMIHLAGTIGGIGANQARPGKFFFDNALMGILLLDAARKYAVKKFVAVGSVCSYPKEAPLPLREETLWDGSPESSSAPYGLAKRMLLVQSQAYRFEYGLNAIYLIPSNLYGPRENFDLATSHVIPALIRKCVEAVEKRRSSVVLWGDGTPTRDFLYVEDAVGGIISAIENYNEGDPVNLGSGVEVSIREAALVIAEETGFLGDIVWDTTQPNGQPRRLVDTSRAREKFGFNASTPFRIGVRKTVRWFLQHRLSQQSRHPEFFPREILLPD